MSAPGVDVIGVDDVQEVLTRARAESIGGVLVDLDRSDPTPAANLVAALLRAAPGLSVGGISAVCSPELPAALIRAGAGAFLSKDAPLDEIRDGVARMMRGDLVVDPAVARRVFAHLDREAATAASAHTRLPHLTGVEQRVLTLAARGRLNKQIARELGLSPFTVKNHLARVRRRLDVATTTEAVVVAMREGLLA